MGKLPYIFQLSFITSRPSKYMSVCSMYRLKLKQHPRTGFYMHVCRSYAQSARRMGDGTGILSAKSLSGPKTGRLGRSKIGSQLRLSTVWPWSRARRTMDLPSRQSSIRSAADWSKRLIWHQISMIWLFGMSMHGHHCQRCRALWCAFVTCHRCLDLHHSVTPLSAACM